MTRQSPADLRRQQAAAMCYFDVFWLFAVLALGPILLDMLMKRSVGEKGAHLGADPVRDRGEEPTPCIRSSRIRADPARPSGVSWGRRNAEEGPARLILSNAQNRGRRQDKQGNPWRVYELNHANLISDSLRSLKWIAPES